MSIELFIIKIINVLRRLSMNIYNLRYFVTLARIRQYTKAAEELCITQPSLSHAISQMEKELGVKLFCLKDHLDERLILEMYSIFIQDFLKDQAV